MDLGKFRCPLRDMDSTERERGRYFAYEYDRILPPFKFSLLEIVCCSFPRRWSLGCLQVPPGNRSPALKNVWVKAQELCESL